MSGTNCLLCQRKTFFVIDESGRRFPLDRLHHPDGEWCIVNGVAVPKDRAAPGAKRYKAHKCGGRR